MKALDAYRDVTRELDKYESPTFNVGDFNYFFNRTLVEYISENYGKYDIIQKEVDDLRMFVTFDKEIIPQEGVYSLPSDYRHVLGVKVVCEAQSDVSNIKKGDSITLYPDRLASNRRGVINDNAYSVPSVEDKSYYWLAGNNIYFKVDEKLSVSKVYIDYMNESSKIYLSPNKNDDFNKEENNTTIDLPNYVYYEVVRKCAMAFFENIESSNRLATTFQQKQLNNE